LAAGKVLDIEAVTDTSEGEGVAVGASLKLASSGEQFVVVASGNPDGTFSEAPPSEPTVSTRVLGLTKAPPVGKDTGLPAAVLKYEAMFKA
jgi:hypothetical protein